MKHPTQLIKLFLAFTETQSSRAFAKSAISLTQDKKH